MGWRDDDRADVNAIFLQPFLNFTTPTRWTSGLDTESSYDWKNEQWSVPVNASASRLMRFGNQLVSLGGGVRYWLDSPDSSADGVGFRITVTLLFGIDKLTAAGASKPAASSSRCNCLVPTFECARPTEPVERRRNQVALQVEQAVNDGVGAQETLRSLWRAEAAHAALPGSGRLVGQLRPVVRVAIVAVDRVGGEFVVRRRPGV